MLNIISFSAAVACPESDTHMNLQRVIDESYQTFFEKSQQAQIILLHPRSRYRSILVAHLINNPKLNTFYYALSADDINLNAFISGICHALASQHATFGRHINMLAGDGAKNPTELLTTFVRDLSELSNDTFYLILDEYDRSDGADDIQNFIEKLVTLLPEHCHIVINSRTLPRLPWVSMIAHNRAILLEDQHIIRENFYGTTGGDYRLEIYALGPGFVLLNDVNIDTWEGHLPRLLFFFALDRPIITRSEICQTFWPELDNDQAVNVFHVTKRRLHKALDMDVLIHENGFYRVNPELDIHYDAMNFATHLMDGRSAQNPNPIAAYQRAVDIYRGPFLQGHNDEWILNRRGAFQSGYLEALMFMADVRIKEERHEHALGLYQRALNEDNTRENLHHGIMKLYSQMGRRSEAAAHFQQFSEDLQKLGKSPSESLLNLYQEIMT